MSNLSEKRLLADVKGRIGVYLRLSITDRCNFACKYCQSDNQHYIPHSEILRYEEFIRLASIAHGLGVKKIRVTGGEPFMRKGCMRFLLSLREKLPDTQICVTSNGVLLEPWLDDLKTLKPGSVNISLDTLEPGAFKEITGHDRLTLIMANVEKLLARNLRVKLNAVIMKGLTDRQTDSFLSLARQMPLDIRFIEYMPMGANTLWNRQSFLSAIELVSLFQQKVELVPEVEREELAGPARMYKIPGFLGRLGFISPLSDHFCNTCNRLRLTSDGKLRICLFDDKEFNMRQLLRNSKISDESIAKVIQLAMLRKPLGADLLRARKTVAVANRKMAGIGG